VSNWSRVFRAGICAVYLALVGGFAHAAGAAVVEARNSSTNLWLLRTWQTDEGLPDNNVTSVAQTSDGQLWVATLGGLMRFDGERFEEFPTTHLPKVPNHVVRMMYLDRGGQLWLVMDRGAVIRVGQTAAFVFEPTNGFAYSRVTAVAEDKEAGVWFVYGNEVGRIWGNQVKRFSPNAGLPNCTTIWLATDAQGELWFTCGPDVGVFRDGRWQTLLTVDSERVRLAAARAGGMWISTPTHVVKYIEGGEPQEMVKLPEGMAVEVMLEDHTGALWIGTAANGLR